MTNEPASQRDAATPKESPILNHKLRGENESFADAVRQGEAAQDEQSRARIVAMLKKASRS
jgi:hypothetical protein